MTDQNLTPIERAEVLSLIRQTIATDRFPLSPRIQRLKSALAKMDPARTERVESYPLPTAWLNSSIGQRKRRR